MKRKFSVLLAIVAVLAMIGCGGAVMHDVQLGTNDAPATVTFDEMWNASIKVGVQQGYQIFNSDKDGGVLILTKGRNVLTQNEPPQLTVIISEVDGTCTIDAQYVQPGQIADLFGTGKKAVKKFINAVMALVSNN